MSDAARYFVFSLVGCQVLSMCALFVGARLIGRGVLDRLGRYAHRRKLQALESTWPLTRIRPAVERGDRATVATILGGLIALKSLLGLPLGILLVFWLPPASLLVPSIVAAHDSADPGLARWARHVATLQVTSHALAASVGFALAMAGPLAGEPVGSLLRTNLPWVVLSCVASMGFAVWAGRTEASGVLRHGI